MNFNYADFKEVLEVLYYLGIDNISKNYLYYLINRKYHLKEAQNKVLDKYLIFSVEKRLIHLEDEKIILDFPAPKIIGKQITKER